MSQQFLNALLMTQQFLKAWHFGHESPIAIDYRMWELSYFYVQQPSSLEKKGRRNPRPLGAYRVCELLLVVDKGDTGFFAVGIRSADGDGAGLTVRRDDDATGIGNLAALLLG
jgi:hypothetical protein